MNIKKYRIAIFLFLVTGLGCFDQDVKAQSNWEAGLRFGDVLSIDATIPLATRPRLHAAAYFYHDLALGAYFDWMFTLEGSPNGLKFYPGIGPEIYFGHDLDIGVAGDFGVEYGFDFPLTIGFDWRPGFIITNGFDGHSGNWGLTARFRFGEGVRFKAE